jgi:hypothetical protein
MRTAQRAVRHSRVRRSSVRARRRIYVGTTVTRRSSSRIFLSPRTQQMASRTRLADWVGGALMACGIAGWGALVLLLGS